MRSVLAVPTKLLNLFSQFYVFISEIPVLSAYPTATEWVFLLDLQDVTCAAMAMPVERWAEHLPKLPPTAEE